MREQRIEYIAIGTFPEIELLTQGVHSANSPSRYKTGIDKPL